MTDISHGLADDAGDERNVATAARACLSTSLDLTYDLTSTLFDELSDVSLRHIIAKADLSVIWSTNSQHMLDEQIMRASQVIHVAIAPSLAK